MALGKSVWIAAGRRTPFTKVDGGLAKRDAIALAVPVVQKMVGDLPAGARVDYAILGSVIPSLHFSNFGREVWLDAKLDATVPTSTTVMACSTSMMAAFQAAGMVGSGVELALVGGSEGMSHVQAGLSQALSDTMRKLSQSKDWPHRAAAIRELTLGDIHLHVPAIKNRTTGKSMGEHCEEMAKTWEIPRAEQDQVALESHQHAVAAWDRGFFDDLVFPLDGVTRDAFPRQDTSLEKLAKLGPVFDTTSGKGTLTAGSSSPLTDGAAGLWVASDAGIGRVPSSTPRVRLVDYELGAVDIQTEGLLMAPAYSIPRLLSRNGLTYGDIGLYEIHEAFAAQLLCHLKALESPQFVRERAGVGRELGTVPRERINPTGGSVALGHPFAATGARILSQAVKELAALPSGTYAIVSICADGGVGTVALLQAP
jgi:acetyl-CoA C-acetyltransferase